MYDKKEGKLSFDRISLIYSTIFNVSISQSLVRDLDFSQLEVKEHKLRTRHYNGVKLNLRIKSSYFFFSHRVNRSPSHHIRILTPETSV